VHLATHLAQRHSGRTLLVDLKPQLGHVALFLGLRETQYHFEELLRNADRLDSGVLNGLVIRHKSGLDVIASPDVSSGAPRQPEHFVAVTDFLRREYDYVLLDSATALGDAHTPIVEQAGEIYIVSTPDVAALRDLARLVERLSVSESSVSKLRIVVNRSTSTDAVGAEQIEKAVRFPIAVSVPNNYVELLRAINDGEPILPQRRSEFNQALARWAERIAGGAAAPAPSTERKGLFSFLR
jgi:pilus assembly protein CpaE